MDFAEPIVAMIDSQTTEEQVRAGFRLAVTVWNALVFDAVEGGERCLEMLRQLLRGGIDEPPVRDLIRRKKAFFSGDLRAIGHYTVEYEGGYLHVHAEARDPFTSSRDL